MGISDSDIRTVNLEIDAQIKNNGIPLGKQKLQPRALVIGEHH